MIWRLFRPHFPKPTSDSFRAVRALVFVAALRMTMRLPWPCLLTIYARQHSFLAWNREEGPRGVQHL